MKTLIGKVLHDNGIIGYLLRDTKGNEYLKNEKDTISLIGIGDCVNAIVYKDGSIVVNDKLQVKDLPAYNIHKDRIVDNAIFDVTGFLRQKLINGEVLAGYRFSNYTGESMDIPGSKLEYFLKKYKVSNVDVVFKGIFMDYTIKDIRKLENHYINSVPEVKVYENADIDISNIVEKKVNTKLIIKKGKIRIANTDKTIATIENIESLVGDKTKDSNKVHYIHLLDTSKSMGESLHRLIKNVKESILGMDKTDLISIITFSDYASCEVLYYCIEVRAVLPLLYKLESIKAYGTTCFSVPLKKATALVEKGSNADATCISLFTDGVSVVGWGEKEECIRCYSLLDNNFTKKVIALNTVGYTNSYNEDFLKKLSSYTTLGKYFHAKDIEDYGKVFSDGYLWLKKSTIKSLDITNKGKVIYSGDLGYYSGDGSLSINAIGANNNSLIIIFDTDDEMVEINNQVINLSECNDIMTDTEYSKAVYSIANTSLYKNEKEYALGVLSNIADGVIETEVANAFTKEEKQRALDNIDKAIKSNRKRFVGGTNYVSIDDIYCIVDMLKELKESNAYIDSETFKDYTRIGIRQHEDSIMFKCNKSEPVKLTNVKYNSKRANDSIEIVYTGIVELDRAQANKVHLNYIFPDYKVDCKSVRNYCIIRDGNLNLESLVVHMTEQMYENLLLKPTLESTKLIADVKTSNILNGYHKYKKVTLNLKSLPILNVGYVKNDDFKNVYNDYVLLCKSKSRKKVLNYYIDEIVGYQKNEFNSFDLEQIEVLENHGLNNRLQYVGVGKHSDTENTDYYYATTYEFKIKNASTMPKVEDVMEIKEGNRYRNGFYVDTMVDYMNYLDGFNDKTLDNKISIYKFHLEKVEKAIRQLESSLNTQKMARILTKTVWTGLDKIEEDKYQYSGLEGTLLLEIKNVKYKYTC